MAILERINKLFKKGAHSTLSDFISDGVVQFFTATTRNDALLQLATALAKAEEINDQNQFYEAILKREAIVSTGIGMGVAIPHAKLPIFDHFFIAVGLQKDGKGIEWDALDGSPVKLIFMIGGPSDQQTEYLKILSRLTTAIKDEDRRKNLLCAHSRDEVITVFKGL